MGTWEQLWRRPLKHKWHVGDLFELLTLALQGVKGGEKGAAPPSYSPHRHTHIAVNLQGKS